MRSGVRGICTTGAACLVVALLGLFVGILAPAVAAASSSNGHLLIDVGEGFTSSPHGSLIDMRQLVPGGSTSGLMGVRNAYSEASDLYLKFTDVTDHDGACSEPGQADCGGRHGQLGARLVFAVLVANTTSAPFQTSWSGSADQLEQGVAVIKSMPASAVRWVRLSATLPETSGNEVQADRLGFNVQVVLKNGLGVDAASVGPSSTGPGALALAVTGASVGLLGLGAALLIVAGWLFLRAGRSRRADSAG